MYSEILKIIESALNNDRQKALNYSKKLANYYISIGEKNIGNKILRLVEEKNTNIASLDGLNARPFDKETKMEMVDLTYPKETTESLIFDSIIENEIQDFVFSYLKRDALISAGIDVNNHLLLYGPPGTGKTSLARYISIQTGLPLITARLDGMVSSLLGSTAKNIRKVFDYASKKPCILFLDEFDVLAKVRDDKNELGELKRVVNSLIQNIDAFSEDSILIAATNHSQLLDEAIWRRFSKIIKLDLPNINLRNDLILEYSSVMDNNFQDDPKKLKELSLATNEFSPAAIKSVILSAAKKAVLNNLNAISYSQVLYEIFLTKHDTLGNIQEATEFLLKYKVSQKEISETLGISLRQVRNIIKEIN